MINLAHLYEGWRNKWFPPEELKGIINAVSIERTAICWECEFHSRFHPSIRPDAHCIDCGCTLSAKTRCLSCECPLTPAKWLPIVTTEQENEMLPEDEKEES